jgi:hypothetical protein
MTPFLTFLGGFIYWWDFNGSAIGGWDIALQDWLAVLHAWGVDLQKFGQVEEQIWRKKMIEQDVSCRRNWGWQRVIGFSHGPSPRDWALWLSERSDCYVGEFWDLVDKPVKVMPGAWPDVLILLGTYHNSSLIMTRFSP